MFSGSETELNKSLYDRSYPSCFIVTDDRESVAEELCSLLCVFHIIVLVVQSLLALCNPIYCSLPGSSVHGILNTRVLEWVAIPFSRGCSQTRD